ncbi:hypothetical protein JS565_23435 [Salmonella enterica subsp. enterica serovar Senftenberg]|nr:hypothetical protein [Salmonella enterica subsp. enterica serovar Senftenberg]
MSLWLMVSLNFVAIKRRSYDRLLIVGLISVSAIRLTGAPCRMAASPYPAYTESGFFFSRLCRPRFSRPR